MSTMPVPAARAPEYAERGVDVDDRGVTAAAEACGLPLLTGAAVPTEFTDGSVAEVSIVCARSSTCEPPTPTTAARPRAPTAAAATTFVRWWRRGARRRLLGRERTDRHGVPLQREGLRRRRRDRAGVLLGARRAGPPRGSSSRSSPGSVGSRFSERGLSGRGCSGASTGVSRSGGAVARLSMTGTSATCAALGGSLRLSCKPGRTAVPDRYGPSTTPAAPGTRGVDRRDLDVQRHAGGDCRARRSAPGTPGPGSAPGRPRSRGSSSPRRRWPPPRSTPRSRRPAGRAPR